MSPVRWPLKAHKETDRAALTSDSSVSPRSVTNYNNVVEAGSESDDEDKLHIVEEEGSLADGADCDSTLPDEEHPREHCWDGGESRRTLRGNIYEMKRVTLNHTSTTYVIFILTVSTWCHYSSLILSWKRSTLKDPVENY